VKPAPAKEGGVSANMEHDEEVLTFKLPDTLILGGKASSEIKD
jgi:hypothetical protein